MSAQIISITNIPGRCRSCGSTEYTALELNLHRYQYWTCYRCLDITHDPYEDETHIADATAYLMAGLPTSPIATYEPDPDLRAKARALTKEKLKRMVDRLRLPPQGETFTLIRGHDLTGIWRDEEI